MNRSLCRSCAEPLTRTFCDLGLSPISNAFLRAGDAAKGEMFYPLRVCVCDSCYLVQLKSDLFSDAHFHEDYVYFSSFSESWLEHARRYVDAMTTRFNLSEASRVIEIASNDGYLLQYFVRAGVPCLGIEPTANTAAAARLKGIETRECFFGRQSASQLRNDGWKADLLLGNNVLAHVPDINDFVGGMPLVLKPDGVVTLEFPHLLQLIAGNQFDTIYHEHYYYLSLTALFPVFARADLKIFDVETLTTHGGSLRIYACHAAALHIVTGSVAAILEEEAVAGLNNGATFDGFAQGVWETKRQFINFLVDAKRAQKSVAAYGAAAKGNTLLNYCGVGSDLIEFVADKNPTKQGRLLPGSRIHVVDPQVIFDRKPDFLVVLPWNIKDEVIKQLAEVRGWGGKFVVAIPSLQVIP